MSSDADDQLKPEEWTTDERDAEQDAEADRPAGRGPGAERDDKPGEESSV